MIITVKEARRLKQKKKYGMILGLTGVKDYQEQYGSSSESIGSPNSSGSQYGEEAENSLADSNEAQELLDAFVTLKYQNQLYRTRTMRSTRPNWEQTFTL